ncbi:MAG: dipeptide ABC transporter ATP-binding protein [Janthinobacterium lividum]
MTAALSFEEVSVSYGGCAVLRGVSFAVAAGEAYGLVGESGCGKSTAALAAMGALPPAARLDGGRVEVLGRDLAGLGARELREMRAAEVSMVFQDAGRALNPTLSVGRQVAEAFVLLGASWREAESRAVDALVGVRLPDPVATMARLPHTLSGGQQQRVVIAMALAKSPRLLVLDEPTTALDATVAAEVLALLGEMRGRARSATLLISHDLGTVARVCARTGVLYAGSLVEEGPTALLLAAPSHPYTAALVACRPRGTRRAGRLATIPGVPPPPGEVPAGCVFAPRCLLADELCRAVAPGRTELGLGHSVCCHHHDRVAAWSAQARLDARPAGDGARVPAAAAEEAAASVVPVRRGGGLFRRRRAVAVAGGEGQGVAPVLAAVEVARTHAGSVRSLRPVSLAVAGGETLGIVGESGSGKTTLARLLVGLDAPDAGGEVRIDGEAVAALAGRRGRAALRAVSLVFQNPDSALNRAHTVRRIVGQALRRPGGVRGRAAVEARLVALMGGMRMGEAQLDARPPALSGGLKQRVAIARAFAAGPRAMVCDEPTSALDVSVQAAVLNLLADLQAEHGTALVLISHDLAVVRFLADRVAVLYLGRLMEVGPAAAVLGGPHHPYTEALVSAAFATPDRPAVVLSGARPSPSRPPGGCLFHTRCPRRIGPVCDTEEPPLHVAEGHAIRCHIPREALGMAATQPGDSRPAPGGTMPTQKQG